MQRRKLGHEFKVVAAWLIRERGVSVAQAARALNVHETVLHREPRLTRRLHFGPLLLSRVQRPFLRVIPWRAKKRDRPLVLVCTHCSARASRNARRKSSGRASSRERSRSACASIAGRRSSPCVGLGAT